MKFFDGTTRESIENGRKREILGAIMENAIFFLFEQAVDTQHREPIG